MGEDEVYLLVTELDGREICRLKLERSELDNEDTENIAERLLDAYRESAWNDIISPV